MIKILVKKTDSAKDLPLPEYATSGSAGMDLRADVITDTILGPGERKLISAGIIIAIPEGYEAQVRPRSGIALKHGISIVNSPGTIDSDYRGIVQVILVNLGQDNFTIKRGDRIAQMVIAPVTRAEMIEEEVLPETMRNDGGFGHTGGK